MYCTNCGIKNVDNFNFCFSCGKPASSSQNEKLLTPAVSSEKVEYVLRPKAIVLELPNGKVDVELCGVYEKMVNTNRFDDIIFDAIFTANCVLIRPVSKAFAHSWIFGALITPGLAETADMIGKKVSSFLTDSSNNLLGKPVDLAILNSLPSWNLVGLYEVRESIPSLMRAASTVMSFHNANQVNASSSKTVLHLVFEGSVSPSKKQFFEFSTLAKLCNFDVSNVKKL